jgi:hypothetical protein
MIPLPFNLSDHLICRIEPVELARFSVLAQGTLREPEYSTGDHRTGAEAFETSNSSTGMRFAFPISLKAASIGADCEPILDQLLVRTFGPRSIDLVSNPKILQGVTL